MTVKILLLLALAGTFYINQVQDKAIAVQRATIQSMSSVPGCMVDPSGLPEHRVAPARHFVPNPPQRSI